MLIMYFSALFCHSALAEPMVPEPAVDLVGSNENVSNTVTVETSSTQQGASTSK